jgi:hypothetical protein
MWANTGHPVSPDKLALAFVPDIGGSAAGRCSLLTKRLNILFEFRFWHLPDIPVALTNFRFRG